MEKKEEPNPEKIKLDEEANMETLPEEVWLMIFSYLSRQKLRNKVFDRASSSHRRPHYKKVRC